MRLDLGGWWVALEGVVGAGKTTSCSFVADALGVEAVVERSDLHPLLRAYVDDPAGLALETELIFTAIHRYTLKQARRNPPGFVTDFSPAKNLIFGRLAMPAGELAALTALDEVVWAHATPAVTVFLDVPPEICLERSQSRGRSYERAFTVEYLARLREAYLERFDTLGREVVRLPLTGDETPPAVAARIVDEVVPRIRGLDDAP